MSRRAWTRYGGDDIEALVSMFICREFPAAFRVRPSRGDGGIDVCVPVGPGCVEIYQVKKFAENLDAGHKRQIVESHQRIQDYARTRHWTIRKWHLVIPLDPTPENAEWFEELEATAEFPCVWDGLTRVEGWVAAHPDIVDYYLQDGRDLLTQEVARFAAISGIPVAGSTVAATENFSSLEPAVTQQHLAALRDTLNTRDPHFQYDIVISGRLPDPAPESVGYPALVASTSREIGNSYVTFHVLARCAESLHERPISFSGTLSVEAGSDEEREFEEFRTYGRTPTVPFSIEGLTVDLPGGLGGTFGTGRVSIIRDHGGETFERRLSVVSPEGETLAEVTVTMSPPVTNHDNTGLHNHGTDATGFLTVETLSAHRDGAMDMKFRFHRGDETGCFPDQIEQSLAFLHHLTSPNQVRIAAVRGRSVALHEIPATPRDAEGTQWNALILRYVRALITLQRHIDAELRVPDLATEDFQHIKGVLQAARLVEGEVVEVAWDHLPFTFHHGVSPPDGLQQVKLLQPLQINISGTALDLGQVLVMIDAAEISNVRSNNAGVMSADLVPALGRNIARLQWLGETSIAP